MSLPLRGFVSGCVKQHRPIAERQDAAEEKGEEEEEDDVNTETKTQILTRWHQIPPPKKQKLGHEQMPRSRDRLHQ